MKVKYLTEPKDQFVTRTKNPGMLYTRTTIHCPLCKAPFSKREFEEHVYRVHGSRADEVFALLYGVPWPAKCSCGKPLRYSRVHKGFPTSCGTCDMGLVATAVPMEYANAEDAKKHVEQLEAMLVKAREEAKRLEKEAEFDKIPTSELPFPSRKDPRLFRRISKLIRLYAANGDQEKLFELANLMDKMLKDLIGE